MSRPSLREVSASRAIIVAAAGLEGAMLVTFFVAVQLLLNRDYFSLSAAQYPAVYAPLFATAVLAALVAVRGSRAVARGRVVRLGLILSAVGRAALIPTIVGAVRHAAVFFPGLAIAGALTGAGFALVYSAATAFALDIDPGRPERHLLRLALTLAAGMIAGPLVQIGLVEAGLWWVFPLIAIVFAVLLIAFSSRSRLGPDAARSCVLSHPVRRVPVRVTAYLPAAFLAVSAVVACVSWSQAAMIGGDADAIGTRALGLGAFWAALTVLAGAAFSAIDMRPSWRRAGHLALYLAPAVVTVIGLATGRAQTTVVGIFLLAAVVCAALLPRASQVTEEHLAVLPPVAVAGVIAIYPVAIALARPSLNGFRSDHAPLLTIFGVTDIVAVAASLICAGLILSRRETARHDEDQTGAHSEPGSPLVAAPPARQLSCHQRSARNQVLTHRPTPPKRRACNSHAVLSQAGHCSEPISA